MINFFKDLKDGNHLCYTHGGLICALTWYIGSTECPSNCSVTGISLDKNSNPEKMLF